LVVVGKPEPGYEPRFNQLISELDEKVRQAIIVRPVSLTPEKYLACADVACVPSSSEEAFGLALLEAMACELPVVATTVGLFGAMVGEYSQDLLVSPGDHGALAERLAWWLAHPDASRACGLRLRKRVTQYFGSSKSIDMYESVLRGMVEEAYKDTAQGNLSF
jgi:glycosyltransferase involved in cell wall biosynthesis